MRLSCTEVKKASEAGEAQNEAGPTAPGVAATGDLRRAVSASRLLGFARADESMLVDAVAGFERMELDWFAGETRKLLASS
jgi:hypothetical protein